MGQFVLSCSGREVEASEKKAVILIDDENISRRKPNRPGHGEITYTEEHVRGRITIIA
jgi:hypothetical protein